MTEFNLSEKRESISNGYGYSDESVKEFIRLLILEMELKWTDLQIINKLAGLKLI